jgi:hypothetical protein
MKLSSTQNVFLHEYLRGTGKTLTARQALSKYNIKNLRARISELRQAGLVVVTEKTRDGFNKYSVSQRDIWGKNGKRNSR